MDARDGPDGGMLRRSDVRNAARVVEDGSLAVGGEAMGAGGLDIASAAPLRDAMSAR